MAEEPLILWITVDIRETDPDGSPCLICGDPIYLGQYEYGFTFKGEDKWHTLKDGDGGRLCFCKSCVEESESIDYGEWGDLES